MKHECHCGLSKHLKHFRARRLGVVGIVLMLVHILFHIVECLVLPAIVIGISEQATSAISSEEMYVEQVRTSYNKTMHFVNHLLADKPSLLTFDETIAR